MIDKNEEYECEVLDNGFMGEGICRIESQVVFVPNAIKGEKIKIKIVKANKNFAFGKLEEIKEKSVNRQEPMCPVFYRCGGCDLQHITYNEQLSIKKRQVENCMKKEKIEVVIKNVIGMGIPYYYRNKVSYPVRVNRENVNKIGFYSKRTHDIIENDICYIQDKQCDEIAKYTFMLANEFKLKGYNEEKNTGDIRHILVRKGYHTDEIMVVIVTNKKKIDSLAKIAKKLTDKYENITSIVQNVNNSLVNDILGEENVTIYGKNYITDVIGDCRYKISASSFYQVNPIQTEVLYNEVKDMLECNKEMTVLDIYSGVGTIGIFISKYVGKIYGIEIVKEAVDMAKENAILNNAKNVEYICGQAEEKMEELIEKVGRVDAIIVDPPRKGLDEKLIKTILSMECKKIIYVSCNPATLARDIKLLSQKYVAKVIQPIDLFCETAHVETVTMLCLKENI